MKSSFISDYKTNVIHVMCRMNIPLYKTKTEERTTRQIFVNLVGKFDFHRNQMKPDNVTFIPRIVGFASSIHPLLTPQAVQMPSMRFNTKITNNICLILNKRFIVCHSSLESQSLLFYFWGRLIYRAFSNPS